MPDRKQNRIRIDAITNAIRKGEYDDKLGVLRSAIDDRLAFKKQEVLSLVQEVYGEGFTVTQQFQGGGLIRGGGQDVLLQSASRSASPVADAPVADALGEDPEIPDAAPGDYESRSPVIGPYTPE